MMRDTIIFCGKKCKVIERYEISEEYAKANDLYYRKRIKFIVPEGFVIDCADTF